MDREELNVKKVAVALGAFAASYLLKEVLEAAYEKVFDEKSPDSIIDEEPNWGKIIGWTIVAGLTTNALKILIKRGAGKKLNL